MDHFEMVEKLREKAQVSYEEAKQALEVSDWDLLDALVFLESEGKIRPEVKEGYSTRREPPLDRRGAAHIGPGIFRRLAGALSRLVSKGNKIDFEVRKKGAVVFTLPLTALILLLIFLFWFSMVALVVGLFFGLRYSLKGPGGVKPVNKAMDRAAQAVESIRSGMSGNNRQDDHAEDAG